MASFVAQQQDVQPENMTGMSRGIYADKNTALDTLFSGVGDAIKGAATTTDQMYKKDIKDDIFKASEQIYNEFGVGAATTQQADASDTRPRLPAELEAAGDDLNNLQNAYVSGNLKSSYYWGRMNSVVRQLRAKYPGYRDDIDSMVASVVGQRPANALRNALFNEWQQAASKAGSEANREEAFYNTNAAYLPPDFEQRQAGPNPYQFADVRAYVGNKKAQHLAQEAQEAQLSIKAKQNSLQESQVKQGFTSAVSQVVNSTLYDSSIASGKTFAEQQKALSDINAAAAAGNPMPESEVQQHVAMISQYENNLRLAMQKILTKSWDGDASHTYASYLKPEDAQAIINQALQPIEILKQGFISKNGDGAMGLVNAYIHAKQDDVGRQLLDKYPLLQKVSGMSILGGGMGSVLSFFKAVPAFLSEAADTATDIAKKSLVADPRAGGLTQSIDEFKDQIQHTNVVPDVISGIQQALANPKVSDKIKEAKIDWMFDPLNNNLMSKFDTPGQYKLWTAMGNPQMTKIFLDRRAAGDEKSWQEYAGWMTHTFEYLLHNQIANLSTATDYQNGAKWDPKSEQLVYDPAKVGGPNLFTRDSDINSPAPYGKAHDSFVRINQALRLMAPIIKSDKGGDVGLELYHEILKLGGLQSPSHAPEAIADILKAIFNATIVNPMRSELGAGTPKED